MSKAYDKASKFLDEALCELGLTDDSPYDHANQNTTEPSYGPDDFLPPQHARYNLVPPHPYHTSISRDGVVTPNVRGAALHVTNLRTHEEVTYTAINTETTLEPIPGSFAYTFQQLNEQINRLSAELLNIVPTLDND